MQGGQEKGSGYRPCGSGQRAWLETNGGDARPRRAGKTFELCSFSAPCSRAGAQVLTTTQLSVLQSLPGFWGIWIF